MEQYDLGRRALKVHVASLEAAIETIDARMSVPVGQSGKGP